VTGEDSRTSLPAPSLNSNNVVSSGEIAEAKVGKTYLAKVVQVFENGDFLVDFMPGKRGFVPSRERSDHDGQQIRAGGFVTVICISAVSGKVYFSQKAAA